MKGFRILVAAALAGGAAWGVIYKLGGFKSFGLAGGLYSGAVTYPAALLVFAIVFSIVYAVMDPGSDR